MRANAGGAAITQDIEANHFWESLGFVPLAFRAGSREKSRVHIFWQRRIRPDDCVTPYWFPAQTTSGAIREDRLVLPIPPGTHWRDVMPVLVPNVAWPSRPCLPDQMKKGMGETPMLRTPTRRRVQFGPPSMQPQTPQTDKEKPAKARKPKVKNDPKLIAAAREPRDRWLEKVNGDPSALLWQAKYDVSRALPQIRPMAQVDSIPLALLTAA